MKNYTALPRPLRLASFSLLLGLCSLAEASPFVWADKAGGKDHPLVSRFQGSMIQNYGVMNFEHAEVPVSSTKKEPVEGKVFNYSYYAPKERSPLEVFRNYKLALEKSRFKIIVACEDAPVCQKQGFEEYASLWTGKTGAFAGGYNATSAMDNSGNYPPLYLVGRLSRPEGDVTAVLTVKAPSSSEVPKGAGAVYFLQVIESIPMQTGNVSVNAETLKTGLAAEGKIALYGIFFDTGKAEIKPQSTPQLDEMAKFLTQQKAVKVYIVGHTDSQGVLAANLTLSQKRAEAIVAALVKHHKIDPARLSAKGVASLAPVASNASDAGREKNRRVELIEQ
ncbi:OmpA family protein [Massilia sp. P8910]|uniref:OmpA family protein n=1 Tax=Massilia antarctica TaxID=2765360 RepID=UPI001E478746|nr:OmpA family protein [Massilia antarctica]MCE3603321.1 OmpA family protein [Massilia antarctica]